MEDSVMTNSTTVAAQGTDTPVAPAPAAATPARALEAAATGVPTVAEDA